MNRLNDLVITLRMNRANILYPEDFRGFSRRYQELRRDPGSAADLDRRAQALLLDMQRFNQLSEQARSALSGLLELREQALSSGAEDFASQQMQEAGEKLTELASRYKKEKEVSPNSLTEARELYLKAQLEAIRNKMLGDVRILLEESRDLDAGKYSPKTLARVSSLYTELENIIEKGLFKATGLQTRAERLYQESRHLLYLTQTARELRRQDTAVESYLLDLEANLSKLAAQLNIETKYGDGPNPVVDEILGQVEKLQAENSALKQMNVQLQDSIAALQRLLNQYHSQENARNLFSGRIAAIRQSLKADGVEVIESGDQVIFRLNRIQYQPGRIYTDQKYQDKLQRIGRILQQLPLESVEVRLGQVPSGNTDYGISLAERRARSAAFIVQSASFLSDQQISFNGFLLENEPQQGQAILDVVARFSGRLP
ncbi:MAG: hypothetical protein WAN36_05925 [Calditrichia bacterium]